MKLLVPLVCALFSGCLAALPPEQQLPTRQACLISSEQALPITIEIAESASERRRGLMERTELAPNAGMLFVYDNERPPDHGFWMFNTLIPLDIAYLGRDGEIRAIRQMTPCRFRTAADCPIYRSGVHFYQALEMNQGYFENHGLGIGDRLSLEPGKCR